MDLKLYYQKIREMESKIAEEYPVIISRDTGDGGREGYRTEVTRAIAAKMVTEGSAQLATPEETKSYREQQAEAKRAIDQAIEASKVQLTVVSTSDLARLAGPKKEKP